MEFGAVASQFKELLRSVTPVSPVNHSTLYVSSDAISTYISTTPLGVLLKQDVSWLTSHSADFIASIDGLAAPIPAFTLPAGIASAIDGLASSLGQDTTGLRYLLALLAAYPLGIVFSMLHGKHLKNAFCLLAGLFLAQVVFPTGWIHAAFSSAVVYAILLVSHGLAALTGIKTLARWAHIVVFAWMMGYMSVVHLYRLKVDYMGWSLDFSGPQMLLTIKLTALAYNLYDGLVMAKKYEAGVSSNPPAKLHKIYADRLTRAVRRIPDPLAFFGYVFCFTAFFAGPAFEFAEYERSVAESDFKDRSSGKLDLRWGSRLSAAFKKLVIGLAFLGAHMAATSIFSFDAVIGWEVMHGSGTSLPYRAGYALITLFFVRTKYYFAWLVSEGASNAAGFGFEKATGSWNGVSNMDILSFELATSATAASKAWNKNTSSWLARYCNQRMPLGINIWATYALSAFWHGFYPGYYLFFLSAPLLQTLEKGFASKLTPRVAAIGGPVAAVYNAVSRVAVPFGLNYLVMPFVALSWDQGITAWSSLYYVGHIGVFGCMALLSILPPAAKPVGDKKKQ